MNVEAVATYLGIVKAGCVVVSIADSLAAAEIALRLRLAGAKAIVTQDSVRRGGKDLPLYEKVVEAEAPRAVVIVNEGKSTLRAGDLTWDRFLAREERFAPHLADPREHTNILFSSGTTGDPKAIPWTHTSPIKCAVDAHLHQDAQPRDRLAWPTNLGWMMGPWLIYASLVNRGTMALFGGAPTGREFGQFVQDAGVTMLGVIPSLVKAWRKTDCMRGLDWSGVARFSSTGECSNPDDMLFLMSLAGYKPVIEYCGGTELAGGYIGGTMAEANVPSAFSTPSFGTEIMFSHRDGAAEDAHEIFLVPPAIGMSSELLHHDHHEVYYDGTPHGPGGETLRRHGDALERLPGNYYRALGRVDDTMNLGGIKVSSAEIERAANTVAGIVETAAVAVPPSGGGPSALWMFAVVDMADLPVVEQLKSRLQEAVRRQLNPLFKIQELMVVESLPRTPSQKVMRRLLRDQAVKISEERMAILRYQAG
jgi:acetyl-CoA synthetase